MNPASLVQLRTDASDAIYRQVIEQVKRRVAAGQLKAGDQVPSVREMAKALAVHHMTISKAYSMLEMEGVLLRRRGLPMVVAPQHRVAQPPADRAELLRPALQRAAVEARQLALPKPQVLQLFRAILDETL
ncbi:MAG: GntR family transcriptional regulator [Burkholderiales bacterium]|nr:MAG: GntR family transcriptional regulator [Burkholderiales bacterium]